MTFRQPQKLKTISDFFKTKDWEKLDDRIFQNYKEEFFNKNIKEINYDFSSKEEDRLDKINNLIDWIKENKKLPSGKEDNGRQIDSKQD